MDVCTITQSLYYFYKQNWLGLVEKNPAMNTVEKDVASKKQRGRPSSKE